MTSKAYANDPLNPQASVLVDCQTDIKLIIKNGLLSGMSFFRIRDKVQKTIDKAISRIRSPTLKQSARLSLMNFANTAFARFHAVFPDPTQAVAIYTLTRSITAKIADGKLSEQAEKYLPTTAAEKNAVKTLYGNEGYFETLDYGVPLQEFSKNYIKRVQTALDDLAKQNALDPNDAVGKNSLRNYAEMQVRYERHQNEINSLRESGVKLVVCSAHGDCSARCSPFQGRVYSLDGTSGTTKDGKKYVPLEEATNPTDRKYYTKSGVANALFGYNCRHTITPYQDGMLIPYVPKEKQIRERKITARQRELERRVIRYREEALMAKNTDKTAYKYARQKAIFWNKQYQEFSRRNGRPFYPDRVKIL